MGYNYVRNIFLGYVVIIILGGFFLSLPICHIGKLAYIDAFFTSASATCVTGLIVTSTSENFTFLGEVVIMILIQCGGIGYMTLVVVFYLFIRNKLTLNEKRAMKESLDLPNLHVSSFVWKILSIVLIIELIGAILLTIGFSSKYPLLNSIWYGIFHSVSAFNNAGFSLFTNSLEDFNNNTFVLTIISFLVIFGGLGYFVLIEMYENRKFSKRYSIHTRIMLYGTLILIVSGMILFLSIEWDNDKTLGTMNVYEKFLNAFFLSINFRTSGFNSIDIGSLKESSLFFSTLFMMVGAGQGSTAGGIKITTVAIIIITVIYILKESNQQPNIFKRTIDQKLINKALAIVICSIFFVLFAALILIETQELPFVKTFFEVVSAFATVGVSTGNGTELSFSQQFNTFGKIIMIILMLAGRLGVFAFGLALIGKAKTKHFQYPIGRIII